MPHIVVKTLSGKPKEKLKEAADQIAAVINKTLGVSDKYISVSVDEYPSDEWESVYNEHIKDKDNVLVKPGYTNPNTFE